MAAVVDPRRLVTLPLTVEGDRVDFERGVTVSPDYTIRPLDAPTVRNPLSPSVTGARLIA